MVLSTFSLCKEIISWCDGGHGCLAPVLPAVNLFKTSTIPIIRIAVCKAANNAEVTSRTQLRAGTI
jgi:hypothetical protein